MPKRTDTTDEEYGETMTDVFENAEPGDLEPAPAWMTVVHRARVAIADAEHQMTVAVAAARDDKATWEEVGDALGVSKQAASQKYGPRLEQLGQDHGVAALADLGPSFDEISALLEAATSLHVVSRQIDEAAKGLAGFEFAQQRLPVAPDEASRD
ncbi:MAG: hypothetical protein GY929_08640 [Actinomycetia bacterium]|nr:hypothetical protein [Actinomycetes bacterium]